MKINYTARNTQLTPQLEKLCERRAGNIDKWLEPPLDVNIILSVEKYRHIAEVNIRAKGMTLNAEEETQDMYSSIGEAFDSIERQAKKEKNKILEKRRKSRGVSPYPSYTEEIEEEESSRPRVFISKNFSLKPLSVEEALILFESMRDDAFGFRVFGSEKWAVLFRRKDGNIGLMELD